MIPRSVLFTYRLAQCSLFFVALQIYYVTILIFNVGKFRKYPPFQYRTRGLSGITSSTTIPRANILIATGTERCFSKDDILVILVTKQVLALGGVVCLRSLIRLFLLRLSGCLLRGSILLLLIGHLLQAVELFSIELVQLGVDILDCVFCSRNDDMFTVQVSAGKHATER
jgi:hypothetical protein